MARSIMTVSPNSGRLSIDFAVRIKGDDLDDQLAFIMLVALRFGGEVTQVGPHFVRGDNKRFGMILVQFPNFDAWDGARAHCGSHLDADGMVLPSYRGALDRADPGRSQAADLRERLMAAR